MEPNYAHDVFAPPSFTFRQLSYLMAAAEEGTIVAAARRMHVSPSAMSDAITELERLVGTRLCVRRKAQGLTLTSAGIRVVEEARGLLRGAQELDIALQGGPDELVGPLAIGCFPTLAPTILPPLLSAFRAEHPRLDIEIMEADQNQLVEHLHSGRIDVAFAYDVQLPGSVRRESLYELPPHIVVAANHPLAGAGPVHLAGLAGEDFIMLDSSPSSDHTLSTFAAHGVVPRIRHRTGNPEVVRTLVGRGLGYGMFIQRHADGMGAKGFPLAVVEVAPPVAALAVQVVWSSAISPTRRARAVIEFARRVEWPGSKAQD
ncbi:LysR substrate-binding domain-containing protein [Kocuria sp. M1N1S27]|uniref:LysR substrate-binding domain-containing protein n=1 Tax=Kocuria kalidii TaxID=3376283 RepID=UPI0037AB45CE